MPLHVYYSTPILVCFCISRITLLPVRCMQVLPFDSTALLPASVVSLVLTLVLVHLEMQRTSLVMPVIHHLISSNPSTTVILQRSMIFELSSSPRVVRVV